MVNSLAKSTIKPTEEETKAARAYVSSLTDKQRRSANGSFTTWCKTNKYQEGLDTHGSDRTTMLELYHIYQLHKKGSEKRRRQPLQKLRQKQKKAV